MFSQVIQIVWHKCVVHFIKQWAVVLRLNCFCRCQKPVFICYKQKQKTHIFTSDKINCLSLLAIENLKLELMETNQSIPYMKCARKTVSPDWKTPNAPDEKSGARMHECNKI